jgi:hypothetical protein
MLEAILQDSGGAVADMTTVDRWTRAYNLPFDVAADPMNALAPYYTPGSFPVQLVLRTSDMSLVYQHTGGADTSFQAAIDGVLASP